MTAKQEAHLGRISLEAYKRIIAKYRRGAEEHKDNPQGGDLEAIPASVVLDEAINEAVDQIVYLLDLREKLYGRST